MNEQLVQKAAKVDTVLKICKTLDKQEEENAQELIALIRDCVDENKHEEQDPKTPEKPKEEPTLNSLLDDMDSADMISLHGEDEIRLNDTICTVDQDQLIDEIQSELNLSKTEVQELKNKQKSLIS